jgi:tetratricopeptide (TPR) repeat protein
MSHKPLLAAAVVALATVAGAQAQTTTVPMAPKAVTAPMADVKAAVAAVNANYADCTQTADLKKVAAACTLFLKDAGTDDRAKLATVYSARAAATQASGDLKGAFRDMSRALAADPKNATLWAKRGDIRQALGQRIRSAADYSVALKYDPKNLAALLGRCEQYRQLGSLPNAIKDADEIIKLDPKSATAYATRAYAAQRLGRDADAAKDADEAIKLDPKSALAYAARGFSKVKADKAAAIVDLKKAVELNPKLEAVTAALKKLGS